MLYFKNKKNIFWGIHRDKECSGKTIGWIKKKKGLTGQLDTFMVCLKQHPFPHPTGNQIIPKGMMVKHLTFSSLADAKDFANKIVAEKEAVA